MRKRTKKEKLQGLGTMILSMPRRRKEKGLFDSVVSGEPFVFAIAKRDASNPCVKEEAGVHLEWGRVREPIGACQGDVGRLNVAQRLGIDTRFLLEWSRNPDHICSVLGLYHGVHQLSSAWTQRYSFYDPISSVLQALSPSDCVRFVLSAGVQGFLGAHTTFGSFFPRFGKGSFSWKGRELESLVHWLGEYVKDFSLPLRGESWNYSGSRLHELSVPGVIDDVVYRLKRDCGFLYLAGDLCKPTLFPSRREKVSEMGEQGGNYMRSVARFFERHQYKGLDAPF